MWPFTRKKPEPKRRHSRAFAGAAYDRLVAGWMTSTASLDSEIRTSLPKLRERSRDLGANNDYVVNFLRTVQDNVAGECGIPFQAQVKMQRGQKLDETTNDAIERAWAKWCKAESCHTAGRLSFTDIERLLVRTLAEDGEFIVRLIYQRMGGPTSSKVKLALELIETDRLDETYNEKFPGTGNEVRMGVEVNSWGRPVAYHFYARHPHDINHHIDANRRDRIRVPASEIFHVFIPSRSRQSRGYPWIASTIMRLHHMGGYEQAEVIAARASASVMGTLESTEDEHSSLDDDTQDAQSVTEFEPGVVKKLLPGEKFELHSPSRPGGQFDPFMRTMLRAVAAGTGASYEDISRDYSQSNYSSSRMALIAVRSHWRAIQKFMIRSFHQALFERWLDMAVLSGELSLPRWETNPELYQAVKWMPRGWSWVDPAKEVAAYIAAVRAGFKTVSDVISESGGDLEETVAARERELKLFKEKGIVLDTNPSQVNGAGAMRALAAAAAASDEQPPGKKKPGDAEAVAE